MLSFIRHSLKFACFFALIGCSSVSKAQLYDGTTGRPATPEDVLFSVQPGSVVVVGEMHGHGPHHKNQKKVLETLTSLGLKVSVGMEFFQRNHQLEVDQFLAGVLAEDDFLKAIGWGKTPFALYRPLVLYPLQVGGTTIGLNARRELTSKIAKSGLNSLSPKEKAELPLHFELGNANYLARFRQSMKGHVPESAMERYFEAQSVWDETMADAAVQFLKIHRDHVLVIIVGDFHAAYGGGLPDRLLARGVGHVITFSQIDRTGQTPEQISDAVRPHPQWGSRGHGVWVD